MRKAVVGLLQNVEEIVGGVLLVITVVSVFIGVVTRYVFNNPAVGTTDLAMFCFTWAIFLGSSSALKREMHLGIDVFTRLLPQRVQDVLAVATNLFLLVLTAVFTYHGWFFALNSRSRITPELGWSYTYVYMALPVGMALMFLRLLPITWRRARALWRGEILGPGEGGQGDEEAGGASAASFPAMNGKEAR